jgi:hypothetical protein
MEVSDEPFALVEPAESEGKEEKSPPSRAKKIALSGLLAVTVVGLGFLAYAGWSVATEKDATLTAPDTIGTLKLDSSEEGRSTSDYLQSALAAEIGLDKAAGGIYTDGSANKILFFGGTALIWSPQSDLQTAFDLTADDSSPVTSLHDVDPGILGGEMKCGNTKVDETAMSVCGWADHGSIAMAMFPGRPNAESATLMVQIREAAQKRN